MQHCRAPGCCSRHGVHSLGGRSLAAAGAPLRGPSLLATRHGPCRSSCGSLCGCAVVWGSAEPMWGWNGTLAALPRPRAEHGAPAGCHWVRATATRPWAPTLCPQHPALATGNLCNRLAANGRTPAPTHSPGSASRLPRPPATSPPPAAVSSACREHMRLAQCFAAAAAPTPAAAAAAGPARTTAAAARAAQHANLAAPGHCLQLGSSRAAPLCSPAGLAGVALGGQQVRCGKGVEARVRTPVARRPAAGAGFKGILTAVSLLKPSALPPTARPCSSSGSRGGSDAARLWWRRAATGPAWMRRRGRCRARRRRACCARWTR